MECHPPRYSPDEFGLMATLGEELGVGDSWEKLTWKFSLKRTAKAPENRVKPKRK